MERSAQGIIKSAKATINTTEDATRDPIMISMKNTVRVALFSLSIFPLPEPMANTSKPSRTTKPTLQCQRLKRRASLQRRELQEE